MSIIANDELKALSPFGPEWMLGAIASNTILAVLLLNSLQSEFIPSDVNIAHGLVAGV